MVYVDSHKYEKIKIDSDDDLPLIKTLTMLNVVIIKSAFNKNHNQYYNIFRKNVCIN